MISALSRCLASCRLSGVGVDGKSDRLLFPYTYWIWEIEMGGRLGLLVIARRSLLETDEKWNKRVT